MEIDTDSEIMNSILYKFLMDAFSAFGDGSLTGGTKEEWVNNWQKISLKDLNIFEVQPMGVFDE